jgi:GH24 family phage-related lysozyme (muramidase)
MLENLVADHVRVHESKIPGWHSMTPGQKVAIISFGWNHGRNFFDSSRTYFDRITEAIRSDWDSVPEVLLEYNLANGVVLPGLTKRRANEAKLWKGEWQTSDGCYG